MIQSAASAGNVVYLVEAAATAPTMLGFPTQVVIGFVGVLIGSLTSMAIFAAREFFDSWRRKRAAKALLLFHLRSLSMWLEKPSENAAHLQLDSLLPHMDYFLSDERANRAWQELETAYFKWKDGQFMPDRPSKDREKTRALLATAMNELK